MLVVFHFREAPAAAFYRTSKSGPAKVRSSWMILGLKVKLHSQLRVWGPRSEVWNMMVKDLRCGINTTPVARYISVRIAD